MIASARSNEGKEKQKINGLQIISKLIIIPCQPFKILLPNGRDIRIRTGPVGLKVDQRWLCDSCFASDHGGLK
jgi:hypothetical protein